MKVYTYSEARQKLSQLLEIARKEEVVIRKRTGETFSVVYKKSAASPFDMPGIKTGASTEDILEAVRDVRENRQGRASSP
jgi:prevent-host-death family protein